MTTYKISKDLISYLKNFNDIQEAIEYANTELGLGWNVTISDIQISPMTPKQQLDNDIFFGKTLIEEFLIDNRELGNIPIQEQLKQLDLFKNVNTLLNVGALRASYDLITTIPTDQYFTQLRKDKYLNQISEFLINNYGTL
jgi:hypothetical protein